MGTVQAATDGLTVRDAVVRYVTGGTGEGAVTAVDRVSLDVPAGQVLALLGPSGCGKSSLLRAVAGIEPLAAGTVAWAGDDVGGVPVHRRGFGLMFQDGQLFAHRDVGRNVAYGLAGGGRPGAQERARRVEELLELVGLPGYARREVATLSGGEKQRVALARSLAPRPRLLLLDEPLSALDRSLRERLATDLRDVLVTTGTTAVFVTHDQDEAFAVADRVAVMDAGRLLQVAAPEELWRAPASRRVAEFLGYQAFVPGDDGSTLAVGPTGLVVAEDGPWSGEVVRSVVRRGRHEVTVQADLGEGGLRRLVATAPDGALPDSGADGVRVALALDPRGCARLGDAAPAVSR
ncbi:ABC transporter ATP-binding protein [Cellulomonas sp. PhB143]|uniref:ABC transporter ATP-binding protein n=1 Tax=Cellulomonas sp. PhB143 TaxID=2485186 RepID=UPI000F47ED08|nr:ABC transporter ATP-binding protein [Cellulomonas sp. PhB143]ROS72111.1 thiamine transport system ATP-binding protein [Cellulomonas sp. PhB143]